MHYLGERCVRREQAGALHPSPLRARAGGGIARADSRMTDAYNRPTQEPACRVGDRAFPRGNGTTSAGPGGTDHQMTTSASTPRDYAPDRRESATSNARMTTPSSLAIWAPLLGASGQGPDRPRSSTITRPVGMTSRRQETCPRPNIRNINIRTEAAVDHMDVDPPRLDAAAPPPPPPPLGPVVRAPASLSTLVTHAAGRPTTRGPPTPAPGVRQASVVRGVDAGAPPSTGAVTSLSARADHVEPDSPQARTPEERSATSFFGPSREFPATAISAQRTRQEGQETNRLTIINNPRTTSTTARASDDESRGRGLAGDRISTRTRSRTRMRAACHGTSPPPADPPVDERDADEHNRDHRNGHPSADTAAQMGPTREVTQHTENPPPVGSPEEGPGWPEAEASPTSMLDELPTGRTSGGPESSTNLGQAEQPEVDRAGAAMTPASPSTASTALTPHPPQPGPSPVRGGDGSPDNRHGAREALQPSTARDPGGPVESDGELSTTPPPRPGGIPDTPLAATTASPQGATPSSNTNEQGERGAGTDPGHNGSDFRPTGTVPRTGPHGDAITGANPASPVGGSGPSSHDRAQSPTGPATTEAANEAPVCGICLGDASEPSVRLPACGHVMCMGCYARASVREVGRVLHCPMCRVGSAIFAMTDALRQQHGDDIVSEAMLVAQSERDLVSATALEASQTQEPRHFCEVCQGLIGRGASTSAPCGCHFHTRCAIGLVEDHLPNALASGHDIISCPYQDQRLGHRFRASTVLPESGHVDVYDSEADRRSLTARIETIRTMLRDLGPGPIRQYGEVLLEEQRSGLPALPLSNTSTHAPLLLRPARPVLLRPRRLPREVRGMAYALHATNPELSNDHSSPRHAHVWCI